MALQQTINIPIGTNLNFKYTDFNYCTKNNEETLENAYIKIDDMQGNKDSINLIIGIYDKKGGSLVIRDSIQFVPDINSNAKNFIAQGYEQLKANKYTTAIDLLDEGQTT